MATQSKKPKEFAEEKKARKTEESSFDQYLCFETFLLSVITRSIQQEKNFLVIYHTELGMKGNKVSTMNAVLERRQTEKYTGEAAIHIHGKD